MCRSHQEYADAKGGDHRELEWQEVLHAKDGQPGRKEKRERTAAQRDRGPEWVARRSFYLHRESLATRLAGASRSEASATPTVVNSRVVLVAKVMIDLESPLTALSLDGATHWVVTGDLDRNVEHSDHARWSQAIHGGWDC